MSFATCFSLPMVEDLVVVNGNRETTALKLIVIHFTEIQNRADVDDLWQTVQSGRFSEKQAQWLMLQLSTLYCPVTDGVTKCIECSRLNHVF